MTLPPDGGAAPAALPLSPEVASGSAKRRRPARVEIQLLGREHEVASSVHYRRAVIGACAVEAAICAGGLGAAGKPNEDALLIVPPDAPGEPALVVVADGHFGADAAELAVAAVGRAWADASPEVREGSDEALVRLVRMAQAAITEAGTEGETTLLLAVIHNGTTLRWASVGDSYLYRLPPGRGGRRANRLDRVWLGPRLTVPVHEVTRRGRFELAPGTRVLLTTDGIPEAIRNVPTLGARQIRAALDGGGDQPLDALVRTALDRGGEDNIAAVLVTVAGEGCTASSKPPRGARWATVWRALRRG
ncbi:MAG: protein phosphatase 2C domain-containing protein [Gammaproteobacteria bacterium]|nr:protein phosphatase 2C domain-containing protein [Gammaproteobacteria bacterium]